MVKTNEDSETRARSFDTLKQFVETRLREKPCQFYNPTLEKSAKGGYYIVNYDVLGERIVIAKAQDLADVKSTVSRIEHWDWS